MRILHVNFSDVGGTGIAARRSHLALLSAGVDSKMLVAKKSLQISELYELRFSMLRRLWRGVQLKYESWLKSKANRLDSSLRHTNRLPGFVVPEINRFKPDVVHLHWVNAGMMSVKEMQRINCPVVWTLHDLWPITGSCHYAGSLMTAEMADQYPTQFEDIDTTGYSSEHGSHYRQALGDKPNGLIVLCQNFEHTVGYASWLEGRVCVRIPNCLNHEIFRSVDLQEKREVRVNLKLPNDKILLLYVAASIHARRKGMDLLLDSLELMNEDTRRRCTLVIVGGNLEKEVVAGIPCIALGGISEEKIMASVYQACDVFICPSREDNFPNTVAESSSCGLPVVAFRTGGLPDMIDHGDTGYLAEPFSIHDFGAGVNAAVTNCSEWSLKAAEKAQKLYDAKRHATVLSEFYERVIAD